MKKILLLSLFSSLYLQASTWSFEGKSEQDMNNCERSMHNIIKFSIEIRHQTDDVSNAIDQAMRDQLDGILQDIQEAFTSGTLNQNNEADFYEVNANLKLIQIYAQTFNLNDMSEKIQTLEVQHPKLLADVCNNIETE